jgi:hypothetical protein
MAWFVKPTIAVQSYQSATRVEPGLHLCFSCLQRPHAEIGGVSGAASSIVWIGMQAPVQIYASWQIDPSVRTDFKLEGSSNYAFNLILKSPDDDFVHRLMRKMRDSDVEFRRGSAGGGNQVRQPYLKGIVPDGHHREFPQTEHIHFYGFYIGNFPDLRDEEVDELCTILNSA